MTAWRALWFAGAAFMALCVLEHDPSTPRWFLIIGALATASALFFALWEWK